MPTPFPGNPSRAAARVLAPSEPVRPSRRADPVRHRHRDPTPFVSASTGGPGAGPPRLPPWRASHPVPVQGNNSNRRHIDDADRDSFRLPVARAACTVVTTRSRSTSTNQHQQVMRRPAARRQGTAARPSPARRW